MGSFYKDNIDEYNDYIEEEIIPSLIHNVRINGGDIVRSLIPIERIEEMDLTSEEKDYLLNYFDSKGIIVDELDLTKYKEVELYEGYNEYLKMVLKKPLTSDEQKLKLEAFSKTHDPLIREELILNNIKYAIYRANNYAQYYDLPFDEVASYAFEGLIYAVDQYDMNKSKSFYIYMKRIVSDYVYRSIEDTIPVTTRYWVASFLENKKIVDKQLESEEINENEYIRRISEGMVDLQSNFSENVNKKRLEDNSKIVRIALGKGISSIEDIVEMEDEFLYSNLIEEFDMNYIDNSELRDKLLNELDNIRETDRNKNIIKLRYGLIDDNPMTLEEVGKIYGISKDRVRQIEGRVLHVLRHPLYAKPLKDFYR